MKIRRLTESSLPDQPERTEARISLPIRGSNQLQQIRAQPVHLRIGVLPLISQGGAVELKCIQILEFEQTGSRRNEEPDRKLDGSHRAREPEIADDAQQV